MDARFEFRARALARHRSWITAAADAAAAAAAAAAGVRRPARRRHRDGHRGRRVEPRHAARPQHERWPYQRGVRDTLLDASAASSLALASAASSLACSAQLGGSRFWVLDARRAFCMSRARSMNESAIARGPFASTRLTDDCARGKFEFEIGARAGDFKFRAFCPPRGQLAKFRVPWPAQHPFAC